LTAGTRTIPKKLRKMNLNIMGLEEKINEIIRQVASIVATELKDNYRLFLFGSRAQGDYDEKSDVDIGIQSDIPISAKKWLTIQEKVEQIPTLLKIDIVDFNTVNEDFKKIALKHTKDIKI